MIVHNPNNLPTIPIADLLPTQGDLKDLTKDNYEKLKKNIERRGFIDPVAVWEDKNGIKYILNGHQRQRVLTNEGWLEPIPYFNVPAKTLQEAAAIVLELTSQYGKITQEGLDAHIAKYDLPEAEIYEATHFDALSFYDTSEPEQEVEEDEAPEVDESEPPKSELGKIYQLGRHRVMCGDSTDKANVELLMNGDKADMVFTDPPYNIDYSDMSGKFEKIKNDKMTDDDFRQFLIDALLTEADTYYVCCSWQYSHLFREALEKLGKPVKAFIVWNKVNPAQNLDKYYKAHEIILYSGKFGGEKTRRSDVWELKRQKNTDHPTMKPIELIATAIDDTPNAKTIYDGFLGSGSTLIACEQTDRTCYGMELDPKYTDVIRKRYAKFIQPDDQLPENWEELTPAIND